MLQKDKEIKEVQCDYCPNVGKYPAVGNDIICPDCREKNAVNTEVPAPIPVNAVLHQAESIDSTIQVRSDVFNAETVSIADIKRAIDTDETIVNKPYALAEAVTKRRAQYKAAIFELGESIKTEQSKLRATQTYLNNLSNQLRSEERERLKISDINYKPAQTGRVVSVKQIKNSSTKLDKEDLRKLAAELNIPEHTVRLFALRKNCKSVDEVRKIFAKVNAVVGE